MLRNLLRRWLIGEDLTENVMQLYPEHRTVLQFFGEIRNRADRAETHISGLRKTTPEIFLHLRNLERRIDALEATLSSKRHNGATWLRLPSEDELSDLIANYPGVDTWPCSTRNRLLFQFGRQWQSMRATGEIILCDKSVAVANAISEALSKLRVSVNPGNNGDQPERLSDSPDA